MHHNLFVVDVDAEDAARRFAGARTSLRAFPFEASPSAVERELAEGLNVMVHHRADVDWTVIAGAQPVTGCVRVGLEPVGEPRTLPLGYTGFVNLHLSAARSLTTVAMFETPVGNGLLNGSLTDVLEQICAVPHAPTATTAEGFRQEVLSHLPEVQGQNGCTLDAGPTRLTVRVWPILSRPLTQIVVVVPATNATRWLRRRGLEPDETGGLRIRAISRDRHETALQVTRPANLRDFVKRLEDDGAICVHGRRLSAHDATRKEN